MLPSRIGTLHLRYRTPAGSGIAAAMTPQIDRVLGSSLGEALDVRLATVFGESPEVIVLRDLHAHVALGRSDWSLDSRVVEKVSRAAVDAIVDTLARPAEEDAIARFVDQAAFVGAFILDLLAGSAWGRWYFGAFHRYRQGDAAAIVAAVLEDNRPYVAAVFGWLARRGQLDAVLTLLGADRARWLAAAEGDRDGAHAAREFAPLAAAAFSLLDALGWPTADEAARDRWLTEYLQTGPLPPSWTDRRSLSAWVMRFAQFVRNDLIARLARRRDVGAEAARALLSGPLDWLDEEWLAPRFEHLDSGPDATAVAALPDRRVLTDQHERALERLAELVRRGRLRIGPHETREAAVVRLLAALHEDDVGRWEPPRGLAAALERIVVAFRAAHHAGLGGERLMIALQRGPAARRNFPRGQDALAATIDAVRATGPAATALLHQLVKSADGDAGQQTSAGGIFLLTRALLDVRLHALAHDAGVPFEPLKSALATWWLDLESPFDAPAALWIGDARPDVAALDACAGVVRLHDALFEVLRNQRAIDDLPPDATFESDRDRVFASLPCADATRRALARVAWMVLRAWSRWLSGVGASGRPFLARNCLQRAARVRISAAEISVALDPAPLDVVLEMAGYFRPIELVPWLDRRALTYTVRRAHR